MNRPLSMSLERSLETSLTLCPVSTAVELETLTSSVRRYVRTFVKCRLALASDFLLTTGL